MDEENCMWNEFEHVEDGRFDPNRDGYYGEFRNKRNGHATCNCEDYSMDVSKREKEEKCRLKEFGNELFELKIELKRLLKEEECYWNSLNEEEQWNEQGEASYTAQCSIKLAIKYLENTIRFLN